MRWVIALVLISLMVVALAGCGKSGQDQGSSQSPGTSQGSSGQPSTSEPAASKLKVALVLPGSASDKGFNQAAYEGLKLIEKELGAEVALSEKTPVANFESVYRDFAQRGYQIIFGHGFEFGEVAEKIGPEFPDVKFLVNSGVAHGGNVAALLPQSHHAAYLAGYLAGLMTKTGKVGGVAGFEYPVIVQQMEAYKLGAQTARPGSQVTLVYIGTFDDVAKGKEAALAQISAGVDVLYHIADAAGVGVIQAAADKGIMAVGWGLDQNNLAPQAVITSQLVSYPRMMLLATEQITKGEFKPDITTFGLDTGVVGLTDYHGLVPQDVADQIEQLRQDIISGKVEVPLINEKSSG